MLICAMISADWKNFIAYVEWIPFWGCCYQTVVYKERDKNLSGAGSLTKIKDNRWQGAA